MTEIVTLRGALQTPIEKPVKMTVLTALADEETTRPDLFDKYVMWKSIPTMLRKPPRNKDGSQPTPREFTEAMGIDDESIMDFLEIKTQGEFSKKYGVSERSLNRWNKLIVKRDPLADIREWAVPLNRNVAMSLYNKVLRGGLPEHYALWFKMYAGWNEKFIVENRTLKVVQIEVHDARPANI